MADARVHRTDDKMRTWRMRSAVALHRSYRPARPCALSSALYVRALGAQPAGQARKSTRS